MWGVIEADPDAVTHNSIDDLRDVMKSVVRPDRVTHVNRAFASFRGHTDIRFLKFAHSFASLNSHTHSFAFASGIHFLSGCDMYH